MLPNSCAAVAIATSMKEDMTAEDMSAPVKIRWWRQGQESQNFGDFLSKFLWDNFATEALVRADVYRLIGSVIDDWIIDDDLESVGKADCGRVAFWCCGMREDKSLRPESRARCIFCGVRGPLTRDILELPLHTAIGDPAFLLPLIHTPKVSRRTKGKTVCSPHILDPSSDEDLVASTGADLIVRASIANSLNALVETLDDLASAEFVLAGSLHSAVVACAYGVPFCYLDRGHVDIPFKWRDFSASIRVGTFFVDNIAEGQRIYETAIRPRLNKPLLFPILAAAPFRVRPDALLRAALNDAKTTGTPVDPGALSAFLSVVDTIDRPDLLRERDRLELVLGEAETRTAELERERDRLQLVLGEAETRTAELERERDRLQLVLGDAETRTAELECERDSVHALITKAEARAVAAKEQQDRLWASRLSQIEQLRQDRDQLARYLIRTYQRPWRPIKHAVSSGFLRLLAAVTKPLNGGSSARFLRSAEKREGSRFERYLTSHQLSSEARRRREAGHLNILYFSPFPSHPPNHGNQVRIQHLARRLQSFGHKVHFVLLQSPMFDEEAERAMREAWDTFDVLHNTKQLWANGSEIPFDGWYDEGLGEKIRFLCDVYDVDVLFCSYVFQSKMLEYIPNHVLKVIDTHDKMGDRYEMLRQGGLPLEFFSCTPEEEGAYLRRADVVVAVRKEEALYFNSVTGRDSAIVVPHVEDPRFVNKRFRRLEKVGLIASANRINLAIASDFLETLSTQCGQDCPFTVHIAGQVKDLLRDLPPERVGAFKAPWVQLHGFVPNIDEFYSDMDAVVSPVTIGTGINIKSVQAMVYGMPLLTTRCGSKGIETDDPMHNYPDVISLVRGLLELTNKPDDLGRLASLSRAHYVSFLEAGTNQLQSIFHHQLLSRRLTYEVS